MLARALALALLALPLASGCAAQRCKQAPVAVQVLGSGGPIADDDRASSAYLVWQRGRARVLIDAGSGTFVRFAEAGATLESLDFIGLSHLHVDHSAGLPALVKSGHFSRDPGVNTSSSRDPGVKTSSSRDPGVKTTSSSPRRRPLVLAGPTGADPFPGTRAWLEALFGPSGAFAYLGWVLDPDRGPWSFTVRELDHGAREPVAVELDRDAGDLRVLALGVEHGPVPALAYRIELDDRVVVFTGDQNGEVPELVELAAGADLLVAHHAVGASPDPVADRLHARPVELAELAASAEVETLVLSHHMARSLAELDQTRASVRERFGGRLEIADDLACYPL